MNKKIGVLLALLLAVSIFQVAFALADQGSDSGSTSGSSETSTDVGSNSGASITANSNENTSNRGRPLIHTIEVRKEIRQEVRNATRDEIRQRAQEFRNDSRELRQNFTEDVRGIVKDAREQKMMEFRQKLREHNGTLEVETEDHMGAMVKISELNDTQKAIIAGKIDARTGLNLTAEDIGNGTRGEVLRAFLSNGRFAEVRVLPDKAAAAAVARLKARCDVNNCTVELKEVGNGNNSEARYTVDTIKEAKILGMFNAHMKAHAEVDPTTGNVILVKKPWWAFLAKEKDNTENQSELEAPSANLTADASVNTSVDTEVRPSGALSTINGNVSGIVKTDNGTIAI